MENNKIWGVETLLLTQPVIIKTIEAKEHLSIQVHEFKSEVFINIEPNSIARILILDPNEYSKNEILEWIELFSTNANKAILMMKSVSLKYMESVNVPKLTFHSILGYSNIYEISDKYDDTLRLFDWNRGRKLNIDKIKSLYQ